MLKFTFSGPSMKKQLSDGTRKVSTDTEFLPPMSPMGGEYKSPLFDVSELNEQLKSSREFHVVADLKEVEVDSLSHKELKWICRRGLSHKVRKKVWLAVSGTNQYRAENPKLYSKAVNEVFSGGTRTVDDFPSVPTFGHSMNFDYHKLTEDGVNFVKKILCCLAHLNPDVDYCPFIADLIAVALNYMDEEDAFYLAARLINRSRNDEWYFPITATHFAIFTETFKHLVRWKLESLYDHITGLGALEGMVGIYKDWFARGFVSHLPRYSFLRVMDTFLYEGSKIFYRVGLGILKLHDDELERCDVVSFLESLANFSNKTHDATKLLEISFDISLSRKDFVRLQTCVEKQIESLHVPKVEKSIVLWPDFEAKMSDFMTVKQCMQIWSWMPRQCHTGSKICRLFATSVDGYNMATLIARCEGRGPIVILVKSLESEYAPAAIFGCFLSDSLVGSKKPVVDRQSFLFSFHRSAGFALSSPSLEKVTSESDSSYIAGTSLSVPVGSTKARSLSSSPPSPSVFDSTSPSTTSSRSGKAPPGECWKWKQDAPENDVIYTASPAYFAMTGGGRTALYLDRTLATGSTSSTSAYGNPELVPTSSGGSFNIASVEVWNLEHMDPKVDDF